MVGIAGEVIPDAIEVDALAAGYEALGVRAVEVEVPERGRDDDLVPRADAGDRRSMTTSLGSLSGKCAA